MSSNNILTSVLKNPNNNLYYIISEPSDIHDHLLNEYTTKGFTILVYDWVSPNYTKINLLV
jgi:hypothetical protein